MTKKNPGLRARSSAVQAAMKATGLDAEDLGEGPEASAGAHSSPGDKPSTAEPASAEGDAVTEAPAERVKPVGLTVRLDQTMHEKLLDLAHDLTKQRRKRVSIHSLLMEGIDLMLAKHGRN